MSEATAEATEVVRRDELPELMEGRSRFDLAEVGDPTAGLETARKLVSYMAKKCTGPEYIAEIQGRKYPKVDWWTTVGGGLGLFPREESCKKLDREGEIAYEATVGVYNGDQVVTRASAICSSEESTWSGRDEYAIRSMAITRATGKAYRVGLSFLPVMAGLEPTPAEEMPQKGGSGGHTCIDLDAKLGFGKHKTKTWREVAERDPGYIGWMKKEGTDRLCEDDYDRLRAIAHPEGGGESGDGSGADSPSSGSTSTETPAGQWLATWEHYRGEGTTKDRFAWERRVLEDEFGDESPVEDGRPNHAAMTEEHYKRLSDRLMEELDEESQQEAL